MIEDASRGYPLGTRVCARYGCYGVNEVETEMGGMCREHASPLLFPIQHPYETRNVASRLPHFVPWEFMHPHERQARENHGGQTLARLSERGGLSVCEAVAVLRDRDWHRMDKEAATTELLALLEEWRAGAQ